MNNSSDAAFNLPDGYTGVPPMQSFPEPLGGGSAETASYREDRSPGRAGSVMEKKLLEMIVQAAAGEAAAAKYYKKLCTMLIAEDDKKIVHGIMLDEIKHRRLFEELFYHLSRVRPDISSVPVPEGEKGEPHGTLPAIFAERIMDELSDVEFYRQIYFALINLEYRDILFEIIIDEQRHAQLMNYLYAKYLR